MSDIDTRNDYLRSLQLALALGVRARASAGMPRWPLYQC